MGIGHLKIVSMYRAYTSWYILLPAGTRCCNNVGFWLIFGGDVRCCHNVVTTLCFRRRYYDIFTTLYFRRRLSDLVLMLQQRREFEVVPDNNLKMLQYHYNFIFPEICNGALQFHFLINIIYSVGVNAKRSLNWKICSSLPEQRKRIFDLV